MQACSNYTKRIKPLLQVIAWAGLAQELAKKYIYILQNWHVCMYVHQDYFIEQALLTKFKFRGKIIGANSPQDSLNLPKICITDKIYLTQTCPHQTKSKIEY